MYGRLLAISGLVCVEKKKASSQPLGQLPKPTDSYMRFKKLDEYKAMGTDLVGQNSILVNTKKEYIE